MESYNLVRPFRASDTTPLRNLCCDTGHAGQPIDGVFPDREIFADYWTDYYIHHEPDTIWVAEKNGAVVGYAMGCFNENGRRGAMIFRIAPLIFSKMLSKGLWFEPKIWSLIGGALCPKKPTSIDKYFERDARAAALHINLAQSAQGQGLGKQLIQRLEDQAHSRGVSMLIAETREDNKPACQFFERLGFQALERRVGYRVRGQTFNVVVYAKK